MKQQCRYNRFHNFYAQETTNSVDIQGDVQGRDGAGERVGKRKVGLVVQGEGNTNEEERGGSGKETETKLRRRHW